MGAVRKMVNRLPFICQAHSPEEVGGDDFGERSIRTGSPFSDPLKIYTWLRERLSWIPSINQSWLRKTDWSIIAKSLIRTDRGWRNNVLFEIKQKEKRIFDSNIWTLQGLLNQKLCIWTVKARFSIECKCLSGDPSISKILETCLEWPAALTVNDNEEWPSCKWKQVRRVNEIGTWNEIWMPINEIAP